uniref:ABC transporter permease n=1 Tax=Liagoropsis maxima TaxID=1653392 RepID=A0A1G4NVQ9_9FLOR|nr:Hypothetical protein ycf63 [Liagoropsis maxima]SCW22715.1 Hypothetical protein ycf63 [Liagoropsis maxima]
MILLKLSLREWFDRLQISFSIIIHLLRLSFYSKRKVYHLLNQVKIMGVGSLTIVILTACFIGMIFTFQVARELTYISATELVGSILTVTFVRELSPVLTAIIVTGRIGSAFTAEIASMKVTEQIDVLYVLNIDPIQYLVIPRIYASFIMLPLLNTLGLASSISASIFISAVLYNISPLIFLNSSYSSLLFLDFIYSFIKTIIFGLIIGVISCSWGLATQGGSINVGRATTSSVVTTLLAIFIADFVLSLLMFRNSGSLLY